MGFLERWGAPAPPAPPAQQAAQASLQTAPKASSTPCSRRQTRTVSGMPEGWGGRAGLSLSSGGPALPRGPHEASGLSVRGALALPSGGRGRQGGTDAGWGAATHAQLLPRGLTPTGHSALWPGLGSSVTPCPLHKSPHCSHWTCVDHLRRVGLCFYPPASYSREQNSLLPAEATV